MLQLATLTNKDFWPSLPQLVCMSMFTFRLILKTFAEFASKSVIFVPLVHFKVLHFAVLFSCRMFDFFPLWFVLSRQNDGTCGAELLHFKIENSFTRFKIFFKYDSTLLSIIRKHFRNAYFYQNICQISYVNFCNVAEIQCLNSVNSAVITRGFYVTRDKQAFESPRFTKEGASLNFPIDMYTLFQLNARSAAMKKPASCRYKHVLLMNQWQPSTSAVTCLADIAGETDVSL